MPVWLTTKEIRARVANVPENWLMRFAAEEPENIRKMSTAKNGTLLFRVSAVLNAIEECRYVR